MLISFCAGMGIGYVSGFLMGIVATAYVYMRMK